MAALLAGAAGTLLRGRGHWPAAGLPARTYVAPPPEPARREAFEHFFEGLRGPLPLLYGYAQRAQLARMLERDFPYRVPGLIHLSNAQRLLAEPPAGAPFELEVAGELVEQPGRLVVAFDVTLRAEGQAFSTCRSLYLVRRERRGDGPREAPQLLEGTATTWQVPADEGRRYAALSGDYNPIHLTPWTARLFGFQRPIMHGMDTAARALAAVEQALGGPAQVLDVTFKRPIALPATAVLVQAPQGAFQVRSPDGTSVHLEGQAAR